MTKQNKQTDSLYKVGANYLIRTVTMIYTGKIVKETQEALVLVDAAWIPETERWADTVEKGVFKEVEPYPDGVSVIVHKSGILDSTKVDWKLPRAQK